MKFKEYRDKFELEIIEKGIDLGIFTKEKQVSIVKPRLACTAFAKKMGLVSNSYKLFAIDYYGYLKKSKGFIESFHKNRSLMKKKQLKSAGAVVIHFAAIKMEDVAKINSDMLKDFPRFKQIILQHRGF